MAAKDNLPVETVSLLEAARQDSRSTAEYLKIVRGVLFAQFMKSAETGDRAGFSATSALTQTEGTGIWASFSNTALAEVVHTNGRQSLLWASM